MNLEVQVVRGRAAGASDGGDRDSGLDPFAGANEIPDVVGVQGGDAAGR
jgi:hypothetical protein